MRWLDGINSSTLYLEELVGFDQKNIHSPGDATPSGRSLDFGEFVYLCSTRQNDFKTPGWAKKEGYRIVSICCDVDMYLGL